MTIGGEEGGVLIGRCPEDIPTDISADISAVASADQWGVFMHVLSGNIYIYIYVYIYIYMAASHLQG